MRVSFFSCSSELDLRIAFCRSSFCRSTSRARRRRRTRRPTQTTFARCVSVSLPFACCDPKPGCCCFAGCLMSPRKSLFAVMCCSANGACQGRTCDGSLIHGRPTPGSSYHRFHWVHTHSVIATLFLSAVSCDIAVFQHFTREPNTQQKEAASLHIPPEVATVEFGKLEEVFKVNVDTVKKHLQHFAEMDTQKRGFALLACCRCSQV